MLALERDELSAVSRSNELSDSRRQVESQSSRASRQHCSEESATLESKNAAKRLTENSDIGIVRVLVDEPLSFGDGRLSRELEVPHAHRVEDDLEDVEDLSKLAEEEDAIAVRLEFGEEAQERVDLARRHPLVVLQAVLLEVLQSQRSVSDEVSGWRRRETNLVPHCKSVKLEVDRKSVV